MLSKAIRGRKSWTLPDVRRSGALPMTKNRARMEIVQEENSNFRRQAYEDQRHQGRDRRASDGVQSSRIAGMRNNSNSHFRSLSRPGQAVSMDRDELRRQGTEKPGTINPTRFGHRFQKQSLSPKAIFNAWEN